MEIRNKFNPYANTSVNNAGNRNVISSNQSPKASINKALQANSFGNKSKVFSSKFNSLLDSVFQYMQADVFKKPAGKILDSYLDIGIDEYNAMPPRSKVILRNCPPCPQEDINELVYLYRVMKENLGAKFPDGYTLVSIGRTPAILAKLLKNQGGDVKFCPISRMSNDYFLNAADKNMDSYVEYFEKLGLTKKVVENSKKPFVFVDYTLSGVSLKNFEELLASDRIGIKGNNVVFLSLNHDLIQCSEDRKTDNMVYKWFEQAAVKAYSPIPQAGIFDITHKQDVILNYKPLNDAKLIQFHLIDALETQKIEAGKLVKV